MLSDFLTLELYFGGDGAALFFEDLAKYYRPTDIRKAVHNGDIECRRVHIGPDSGRMLYGLSAQGRAKLTPD